MRKEKLKDLKNEELRSVNGGVMPGPNGESCTEHGLPDFLKSKDPLVVLKA